MTNKTNVTDDAFDFYGIIEKADASYLADSMKIRGQQMTIYDDPQWHIVNEAWQSASQHYEREIAEAQKNTSRMIKQISFAADAREAALENIIRDKESEIADRNELIAKYDKRNIELQELAFKRFNLNAELSAQVNQLREAGQALVDRWHTPKWKDVEHTGTFIHNLEKALAATAQQSLQAFDDEITDADRIEWLENENIKHGQILFTRYGLAWTSLFTISTNRMKQKPTIRSAIDAALKSK